MTATAVTRPGIRDLLRQQLAAFLEAKLAAASDDSYGVALKMASEFVLNGGKRLRGLFCYWGWRGAGGADCSEILVAAAALELFHAFALIHDDVIDDSATRRGVPALHCRLSGMHQQQQWHGNAREFGAAGATLLGDLLHVWAGELLRSSGLPVERAWWVYDQMRSELVYGQYLDLALTAQGARSIPLSLKVATLKSAKYTVERPLQFGGALAGASADLLDAYSAFGIPVGQAFQLRDDVLGIFGDPAVTGKPVLDDLRAGKPTVLAAYAVVNAAPAQLREFERSYGDPQLDEQRAARLREIISETGALQEVEKMISRHQREALAVLDGLPDPAARAALAELAEAATVRPT